MEDHSSPCKLLDWDSNFFGFQVASVVGNRLTANKCKEIDEWCTKNKVVCLYFLASSDDPKTTLIAQERGYRFVDVRITYGEELNLIKPETHTGVSIVLRTAIEEDIPALRAIAKQSHADTRFFYDPGFENSRREVLYETWIETSCQGYADQVLVALNRKEELLGYVTCHSIDNTLTGKIGLLAVSKTSRGMGIGRLLVHGAAKWFSENGSRSLTVVTQGRNVPSQRLYQRCGLLIRDVKLWYHKWYRDPSY